MNATTQTVHPILFSTREHADAGRKNGGWTIAGIAALLVAVAAMALQPAFPQSSGAAGADEEASSMNLP